MKKQRYNAIFISDIHLGHDDSGVSKLLSFLESVKSDYLYICGDMIDFYHLYEHHGWSKKCNLLIRRILSKVKKNTKVRICIGNHDAFLGILCGFEFGGISIDYNFIHSGIINDYLVIHGDGYDKTMGMFNLSKICCFIHMHLGWVPLIKKLSSIVNKYTERGVDVDKMRCDAHSLGCYGVIFGHTHSPSIDRHQTLMNCGDWITNHSALCEDKDGNFELITFKG